MKKPTACLLHSKASRPEAVEAGGRWVALRVLLDESFD